MDHEDAKSSLMSDNEQRQIKARGSRAAEIETDEDRKRRRRRRMGPDHGDFTKDLVVYPHLRGPSPLEMRIKNKLLSARDVFMFQHVLHTAEYQPFPS